VKVDNIKRKEAIVAKKKKETVQKTGAFTRLTEKAYSPLTIRKNTRFGFPIFVGIITDDDLDELDSVIVEFIQDHMQAWKSDSVQDKRWIAGALSEKLTEVFIHTEGVAILLAVDKMMISSLFGDFMNHAMCRDEWYFLLNMSTGV